MIRGPGGLIPLGLTGWLAMGCHSDTSGWASSTGTWGSGTASETSSTTSTVTSPDTGTGPDEDTGVTSDLCSSLAPLPTVYLSPDDSNSYASATLCRDRVLSGRNAGSVRIHELFNAYGFDVPAGPPGSVALSAEWLDADVDRDHHVLQVAIGAEVRQLAQRAPINLTFVVDTSGSMSGAPIRLAKEACRAVAARLQLGDTVSMVTWNTGNNVELDGLSVNGPDDGHLLDACDRLSGNGGTNLHRGLVAGYQLAEANWLPGMTNRIVLISDGGANVGVTDEDLIARKAWLGDGRDIFMVGIGVASSPTGYNDLLMDTVSDAGRGASLFATNDADIWAYVHDRFLEVFEVAVTDVRLELDLPAQLRIVRTSAEEMAIDPAVVRPQYLAPNAEMVFYNALRTPHDQCLDDGDEIVARATFTDPAGLPQVVEARWTIGELRGGETRNVLKGKAVFALGVALKATNPGFPVPLDDARAQATAELEAADPAWPGDPDHAAIRDILDAL